MAPPNEIIDKTIILLLVLASVCNLFFKDFSALKNIFRTLSSFGSLIRHAIKQSQNMKTYSLLFRGGMDYVNAAPEALQSDMMKWKTWMDGIAADGRMVPGGHRLGGASAVVKGSGALVTDGPFAEGKEVISGFIAIKAKDLDEAVMISKGCPIYEYEGSTTEVREVAEM